MNLTSYGSEKVKDWSVSTRNSYLVCKTIVMEAHSIIQNFVVGESYKKIASQLQKQEIFNNNMYESGPLNFRWKLNFIHTLPTDLP